MAQDEGLFDVVQFEFVAYNLVVFPLSLEQVIVVLLLHLILLDHTGAARHQFHLLKTLLVLEQKAHDALQSIYQQESPRHGGDISWVERLHSETLLEHGLEFVAERERHLCRDKTLENATNSLEHKHVDDTVQVLFDHVVHHVWVLHHVHWVRCSDLSIKIAITFLAEELLTGLDGVLGEPFGLGSDFLAAGECLRLACVSIGLLLEHLHDLHLLVWHAALLVRVLLEDGAEERGVRKLGFL